ncbi:MAG: FAD-dependent oxidoreductase [Candidatus Lokiarchaeota archaeon]|nr:FAD-dependent oxidoreductase [Candidatus Lokiarchaeota archaeon]
MPAWNVELTDKIERTSEITSFRFNVPENLSYLPGQFFFVYIPAEGVGSMMHHFSFSSSPSEPFIEFTTRIRESPFKNRLNQLEIGTYFQIASVSGQFTITEKMKKIVFVCGGIGITAARSNIKSILDSDSNVDIILLYGNRNANNIAFKDELDRISEERLKVFHILSDPEEGWAGSIGFINAEFISSSVPDLMERTWFISGPPAMVKSSKDIIISVLCVSEGKVKTENYVGY